MPRLPALSAAVRRALVPLLRAGGPFLRHAGGGVAVLFGITVVPLILFAGAALDYTRASDARTILQVAADAAALSAVTQAALVLTPKQAESQAVSVFNARAATVKFAGNVDVTVKVKENKTVRTAAVSFTADVPTTLMRLAGWTTVPIAGDAKSASPPPTYMDFHLLLDNTPSMGVGATPADIATMVANTPDKCAFACHDVSAAGKDYYALAKKLGVQMRIDVVRSATQQLMDTATATAMVPGQFRAGIHTFGALCSGLGVTTLSGLTSNLAGVKTSAAAIDLMSVPFQNYNNDQCTDFDGALTTMNTLVAPSGDGSTSAAPQKIVFFVSDGVADAFYPSTCTKPTTGGRCQEPISQAGCTALKDRGVKIAVLYTTYLPLPTNGWYNQWIAPFASQIPTQMQSCASPGLYFEVSPSQGISDAMAALFQRAVAQARLSE